MIRYVLLPACNEEKAIGPLIGDIRTVLASAPGPHAIVVVEDGSTDRTAEEARMHLTGPADRLLVHPRNRGLGQAMMTGLTFLDTLLREDDVAISMDADGTHLPAQIPSLVERVVSGRDVVVCSRFPRGATCHGVPLWRAVGSRGLNRMLGLVFRAPSVRDFSTNYRAYSAASVRILAREIEAGRLRTPGFGFVAEALIRLLRLGADVCEVPIVLRYDRKQDASKMRVLRTLGEYAGIMLRDRQRQRGPVQPGDAAPPLAGPNPDPPPENGARS